MSQYVNVQDFDYNATINKAVTIKNGNDLKGAALTVVTDGVKLDGIQKASVTTNSSLKISSSSLSSLSIAGVSSAPSANQVSGRGDTQTSSNGSAKPPVVEVDNTTVDEDVSVAIANAYLTVDHFTAKKAVSLDAANVQLTINDTATNINEIKTDKVCQVILEDGTSDTIPTPNVTGEGELKQIDMKAAGTMKLVALTPMSGLTTVAKQGEAIDFSTIVLLGTYQADDGITLFKARGLTENLTETFSKIEKKYKVSINGNEVFKNGENVPSFDWTTLSADTYSALIDSDYETKDSSYRAYSFNIVIIGAAENQTEIVIPTFELQSIELKTDNVKTTYNEGEPLNLTGLIIEGTYHASVGNISYKNIMTDYTLTPPNGTILTTTNTAVTVKVSGMEDQTIPITVNPMVKVTFLAEEGSETSYAVQRIIAGTRATEPANPTKTGYTFDAWYDESDVAFIFTTPVNGNITLTAKWTPIIYTIKFEANGGTGSMSNKDMLYDTSVDLTTNTFTKDGCLFVGWASSADGEVVYTDGQEVKDLTTDNGAEVTLYAIWKEKSSISVGDIMYSDMTFSSEYVDGKTPLGIVFEVSTKVKIVHLSEQSSLKWCLDTAGGYNCNPATSTFDGSGNWQIICDTVSDETTDGNYPAFEYVNGLGSGWYLPAKDELNAVYTNKADINAALTKLIDAEVSATELGTSNYFGTSNYWSSSSYDNRTAWFQNFDNGNQNNGFHKYNSYSVRAVRAF